MTKAKAKKTTERESLIVTSKVKEFIKERGLQSSADVVPALNNKIYEILEQASERTTNNGRATVRPHDL
ncbi:MAG: hypothetical protein V1754_06715 [Pseudomonadota bacterium]